MRQIYISNFPSEVKYQRSILSQHISGICLPEIKVGEYLTKL